MYCHHICEIVNISYPRDPVVVVVVDPVAAAVVLVAAAVVDLKKDFHSKFFFSLILGVRIFIQHLRTGSAPLDHKRY